ncbi:hypothetical protein Acr_16g0000670 [Actinidia rufa]|uniref:Uncharacterized protein n=1 Tax=Actinidia rufa TaxID=165716 RepID=A0A7J0FXN4_9ERIC|nr:hypothetical protein Acr_16g0000670 [Actinidia rufa]
MTGEVNQSPDSPREDLPTPEDVPMVTVPPSIEKETNIMTLDELDLLRETYSFPPYVLILQFYNICPAQLIPNAWRSVTYAISLWRAHKYPMSISEFRHLFSLNNNPKPDHDWLYFKEFFEGSYREYSVPRVPKSWGIPDKRCNNPPRLYEDEIKRVEHFFNSIKEKGLYSVPTLLASRSFQRVFGPLSPVASGEENKGEDRPADYVPTSSSDAEDQLQEARSKRGEIQGRELNHKVHPGKGGDDSLSPKKGDGSKIPQCGELKGHSCEKTWGGHLGQSRRRFGS